VAWFVNTFAAALSEVADKQIDQPQSVLLALERVRARFDQRASGTAIPLYAHPLAAMTWIRITDTGDGATLDLYCLGDCKAFLLAPGGNVVDLDPWVNPQEAIVQAQLAQLAAQGFTNAADRRERLLPMLRARREQQHSADSPGGLCLQPRGAFAARRYTLRAEPGAMLLAMTDGFSRIFDTYGLCSLDDVAQRCLRGELPALLAGLRAFESRQFASSSMTVKRADDASAVTWFFGPREHAHG
jgi:hypothetical protein